MQNKCMHNQHLSLSDVLSHIKTGFSQKSSQQQFRKLVFKPVSLGYQLPTEQINKHPV